MNISLFVYLSMCVLLCELKDKWREQRGGEIDRRNKKNKVHILIFSLYVGLFQEAYSAMETSTTCILLACIVVVGNLYREIL